MSEIRCPKCGETFKVDESGYEAIVSQVRNVEFYREIEERERIFATQKESELKLQESRVNLEKERSISELTQEIERLKSAIKLNEQNKTIAVNEAINLKKDEITEKEKKILELENRVREAEKDNLLKEQNLKEKYEIALRGKDETIEFYKDMKSKLSTKMVGETLEQHCEFEFNRLRATAFPNAYFEKDNDVRTGSKGDYIFREETLMVLRYYP